MLETFTLSNGIHVVTYSLAALRSVHLQISVKGGSLVESFEKNGIAHFMEHMLVQGSPSFPNAQDLSLYIEGLAGKYNAYTSQLSVSFAITVPFSHTNDAVRIASEVFFEPLFPEDAIEKERRAVINEIKQDIDSRWFKFQEFFKQIRFTKDSHLQKRIGGTSDTVEKLTRQDLVEYWKKYFFPKNTYLFLIGNINKNTLLPLLEEYFGKHKSNEDFSGFPKLGMEDIMNRTVAIRSDKDLQVNYIDLIFPSLSLHDDVSLRIKQNTALIILSRLRTSRLFQLLRYKRGLVYSVSASDTQWPGVGYVYVNSEVSTEHVEEVVDLMVKEISSFREHGPLEEELAFTKNYLSNSWLMSFDDPTSITEWISEDFLWKDEILLPEDNIKILETIKVKDLVDVMQKYWDMSKLQLIIQGPILDTKENKEKFKQLLEPLK